MKVSIVGEVEAAFLKELRARTPEVFEGRPRVGSILIFFAVEAPAALARLPVLKKSLQPARIWVSAPRAPRRR